MNAIPGDRAMSFSVVRYCMCSAEKLPSMMNVWISSSLHAHMWSKNVGDDLWTYGEYFCLKSSGRLRPGCYVTVGVMFELNALLNLSWQATTKSLCPLRTELLLQVLSESTGIVTVQVIRGDEGMGDIPGVQGVSGGVCGFCAMNLIDTRTQT